MIFKDINAARILPARVLGVLFSATTLAMSLMVLSAILHAQGIGNGPPMLLELWLGAGLTLLGLMLIWTLFGTIQFRDGKSGTVLKLKNQGTRYNPDFVVVDKQAATTTPLLDYITESGGQWNLQKQVARYYLPGLAFLGFTFLCLIVMVFTMLTT